MTRAKAGAHSTYTALQTAEYGALPNRAADDVLLIDAATGREVTVGDVEARSIQLRQDEIRLAFLLCEQSTPTVTDFLALMHARVPVALIDGSVPLSVLQDLVRRYEPDTVVAPPAATALLNGLDGGVIEAERWRANGSSTLTPHPDLAVLLSTSGSTGSPKFVRLSRKAIAANAIAIGRSLSLTSTDRVVTSLPLHYSFGMSLVTSHIWAGSAAVVTSRSILDRQLWDEMRHHCVTHFAGVPQTFLMLKRLKFSDRDLPSLRALLQAGGRLEPAVIREFAEDCARKDRRFFVMYGQTEASPRMACLPPDRVLEKLGSVGLPLDGGLFTILGDEGQELEPGLSGEICYAGPNVMMGYASCRDDVAKGDELGGRLHTGDLGYLDEEGYLFLTGRKKRIAKISGIRISLDEVEGMVAAIAPVAAVAAGDEGVVIFTTCADPEKVRQAHARLARDLGVPPRTIQVRRTAELPLLASGKVDYRKLTVILNH